MLILKTSTFWEFALEALRGEDFRGLSSALAKKGESQLHSSASLCISPQHAASLPLSTKEQLITHAGPIFGTYGQQWTTALMPVFPVVMFLFFCWPNVTFLLQIVPTIYFTFGLEESNRIPYMWSNNIQRLKSKLLDLLLSIPLYPKVLQTALIET